MTTTRQKPTTRIGTAFAAGVIAVGAMLAVTAPAANAYSFSESQIETFCHVRGGAYDTYLDFAPDAFAATGTRYSYCNYKDLRGNKRMDVYVNGEYTETLEPL